MTQPIESEPRIGAADPRRVPDLRDRDVPQLVLAGRPLAPRPRRGRGMARRLGRERGRVGLLGRAERGVPLGDRRASPRPRRRRRRHDLRLAGRQRARLRAAARRRAEPHRDLGVRVPDRRPDRPRAGARGAPRSSTCHPGDDGSIGAERFAEAIDERTALVCCTTLSYRSGHRHDVSGDRGGRPRRRARSSSPTATRRAARSSSTSARSAPTRSPAGR